MLTVDKICPTCTILLPDMFECLECNRSLEKDCRCVYDTDIEEMDVRCHGCNEDYVVFTDDLFPGVYVDRPEDVEGELGQASLFDKEELPPQQWVEIPYTKCRHYDTPVKFKDGTTIYATSMVDRNPNEAAPDLGVYLDKGWHPTGLAFMIDWPDFGIPRNWDAAGRTLIESFRQAKFNNLWVEVGCIGGHGRTGTALACYGVLSGLNASDAIKHVRKVYCEHTIETKDQIWFVEWFEVFINGGEIDTLPEWNSDAKAFDPPTRIRYKSSFNWEKFDFTKLATTPQYKPELKLTEYTRDIKLEEFDKMCEEALAKGLPLPKGTLVVDEPKKKAEVVSFEELGITQEQMDAWEVF